jgi:acyl-CoA synthetase (AMP-forming)/AMP-acid ligase II
MAETVFAVSQLTPAEQRALAVPRTMPPGADVLASGGKIVTDGTLDTDGGKLVLSSGRVVPGLDVRVRAAGEDVGPGIYGEICIGGDFLFPGYRGQGPLESSIDDSGLFNTGDLGTVIDGHVYVFGRLKEIIIVNGKNLFAGDVEDILNQASGVKKGRVVAFGVDSDQTGSEELVVVAEHDPQAGPTTEQTRADVSRRVSEALLVKPRDVRIVDQRWLVKSTSGKISRNENRQKYLDQFRPANSPGR